MQVLVEDQTHDRRAHGVQGQRAAGESLPALVGIGVLVAVELVAVQGGAAHVPALADAGLDALAGGLLEVEQVAAGQADVEVAQHDRAERLLERLVGAVQ
ncbi:MAG TPA: hypothetical protein VFA45_05330 [Actinomycetes bacterium]|nr:hypothetical protein [Actinomycetes bacterium]